MRTLFVLLFFITCRLQNQAQVNLVLNPSFEITDSCNVAGGRIKDAQFWEDFDNTSNFCWAQLISTCCTIPNQCGVNAYSSGASVEFQFPRTGNAYCLLEIFSPPPPLGYTNLRRYVIGTLSSTLVNGKSYCGKVYVNLSSLSSSKINQFGMYYDNGVLMGTQTVGCLSVLPVTPQVANNPAVMLDDSMNWMRVQGIFTANGTESRVTLGNFKDDANTIGIATGFPTSYVNAIYNIDDVSLIATSITAYAGSDATICLGDSQHLGRPQEVGLECLWYKPNNATPFASTSDIWFKPTTAGSYTMVQRMDNCAITWDTVNITVITDCSLLQPTIIKEIPNVFTPNGDGVNDTFMFEVVGATDVGFTVYNRWGLDVVGSSTALSHQTTNNKHQTTIQWNGRTTSGEQCSDGVYYYVLRYKNILGEEKKVNGYITLIR